MTATPETALPTEPVDVQGILADALVDSSAFVVLPLDELLSCITIANHQTRDRMGHVRPGRSTMYLLRMLRDRGHVRTPNYDTGPPDTR